MRKQKLKGLWIPAEILLNNDLSDKEKIILSMILYLSDETGSREEWCDNNIYDFAGNVDEWTQEQNESSYRVIRGGNCGNCGDNCPVAYRSCNTPDNYYFGTGFRATLYIK